MDAIKKQKMSFQNKNVYIKFSAHGVFLE